MEFVGDGFAQCSYYKDPPGVDSEEYESSDEDVFSPVFPETS